ncbi:MAG: penicillin-binding protein 2 [Desulfobacterales bacterium]|nr:penicillin-binding protein 2 [Desulfobacterales bacterium]
MITKEPNKSKIRVLVVGILFSICFTVIVARAVDLHLFKGPWLSQKADGQVKRPVKALGERGVIFDANMGKMALSIDVTSIGAHPKQIKDVAATAKYLAKALRLDRNDLVKKLSSNTPFVWIERHVTPKKAEAVEALNLNGVVFKSERSRFYPYKTMAAQIVGFSGVDGRGLEGVEFFYDRVLEGQQTQFRVIRDALGRGLGLEIDEENDRDGKNLILTIDRRIQYIAENALAEAVTQNDAKNGIVVVMSPKTGAVMAMAHYPFINANTYNKYGKDKWRNRAITDPFEPGSTFKIFSAAAAIESGVSGPHSLYYCENGSYRIGRNVVHDTHRYQWLSLEQIIQVSSNIGTVKLSESIGTKNLYDTLKNFGFGEKTGIDCPGETSGMLSPYQRWKKIDNATIAFGQGIAVSAIQLITAVSAIANDGILMKPYVVQAITDKNGAIIEKFNPHPVRRAVSSETAAAVGKMMEKVTEEGGTGTKAALAGYKVCGKTGTAQKIDETGTYAKGKYVSSFVGFVPAENPVASILVMIDEPQKAHYGGVVAAPVFQKVAFQTLNFMNIPPDGKTDHLTADRQGEVKG